MKRNTTTNRQVRHGNRTKGKSGYAEKVRRGEQMYGPGCCGHRLTEQQVRAHKSNVWPGNPAGFGGFQ